MAIWGTIGMFVREIELPTSVIALVRGIIGTAFLLCAAALMKRLPDMKSVLANWKYLLPAGAGIGLNWIFLFEAYRATSVATATLAYYMAPVFVIVFTPWFLKERVTFFKMFCAAAAVFGMVLISGVFSGVQQTAGLRGIAFGLAAACLYAAVVFCNKFLKNIDSMASSIVQLAVSAVVVAPYVVATVDFGALDWSVKSAGLTFFVGIVHTGVAYGLYFSALPKLEAVRIAIFSYIDPALAIVLSVLVLNEPMTLTGVVGAMLILGATLASELAVTKRKLPVGVAGRRG